MVNNLSSGAGVCSLQQNGDTIHYSNECAHQNRIQLVLTTDCCNQPAQPFSELLPEEFGDPYAESVGPYDV